MVLYHATTLKKYKQYKASGCIHAPVRGFTTVTAALAWALKVNRTMILKVEGCPAYKLPDHHNAYGEAWWIDFDVVNFECEYSIH